MKASACQALNWGDSENRLGLRSRHLGHPRRSNFLAEQKIRVLLPSAVADSAWSRLKEKKSGSRNKTRSLVEINPTAELPTYRTQNSVRTTPATSALTSNCAHNSASVRSSRNAAKATRALNAGLWVRRVRRPDAFFFTIRNSFSPDRSGPALYLEFPLIALCKFAGPLLLTPRAHSDIALVTTELR